MFLNLFLYLAVFYFRDRYLMFLSCFLSYVLEFVPLSCGLLFQRQVFDASLILPFLCSRICSSILRSSISETGICRFSHSSFLMFLNLFLYLAVFYFRDRYLTLLSFFLSYVLEFVPLSCGLLFQRQVFDASLILPFLCSRICSSILRSSISETGI